VKKRIITIVAVILVIAIAGSGWGYYFAKSRQSAKDLELTNLQSSFSQWYGTDGITVTQIVSPSKVYAASWTSKDGATHVSWSIGGVWVTVINGQPPAPTATP
jgi:hypothetical protein